MLRILTLSLPIALAACAQNAASIAPVSMGGAYAGTSCAAAQSLLNTETQNLAALSAKQQSAVTGDALGVLLLGVPVSSLSGADNEGAIAASKGKILALEARLSGC